MKKQLLTALCLIAGTAAFAQLQLVKEAEGVMKSAKTYAEFAKGLEMITPAFSNPETADKAATYAGPSGIAFKHFDKIYADKQFGKEVTDPVGWFNFLMSGYTLGNMAMDVDTVVNAKGKVETKYSKDIANKICGHLNDFQNAGATYWDEQDFGKSYEAFTAYIDIIGNPKYGKYAPAAIPDSAVAQIDLYRAYAAMNAQMMPQALQAFDQMVAIGGINDPAAYKQAYFAAYQNNNDYDRIIKYATQANEKFGDKDNEFMEMIVNAHIDHKDYPTAQKLLEDAIASDPSNPGYYYSMGFLKEAMKDIPAAKAAYKKAAELNPKNARALYRYANAIAQEFDALDNAASEKMADAEYNKYYAETLKPMLQEIVVSAEAAYAADDNMNDALRLLKNIYYRLNDAKNYDRIEKMLL